MKNLIRIKKSIAMAAGLLFLIQQVVPAYAGEFVVFEKEYRRTRKLGGVVGDQFEVPNPDTQWTLKAKNGKGQRPFLTRVAAAFVNLNGELILGARQLNKKVSEVEVPVELRPSNMIRVRIISLLFGVLRIQIVGVDNDPPVITNLMPADGAVLSSSRPNIRADYGDALSGVEVSSVRLFLNDTDVTSEANVTQSGISFTPGSDLGASSHTVRLLVGDKAGNQTEVQSGFSLVLGNRPPVLNAIGSQSVSVGNSLQFTVSAADPDNDALTFSVLPLPLPVGASFSVSSREFRFTPGLEQVGDFSLTFSVSDGEFSDRETVVISVLGPAPGSPTSLEGRILDTNDFVAGVETPVVGAVVSILGSGVSSLSDSQGRFFLNDLPSGNQVLDINTFPASPAPDGSAYAGFREKVALEQGVHHMITRPFFLPRIAAESSTIVDPEAVTVVQNSALGITMTVPPHAAKNPDGTDFTGVLSISEVPEALAPASLPRELDPGLLITIQPVGVTFDPVAPITFPNTDNLPAGTVTDLWSLDPGAGIFIIVGKGRVSADGLRVETFEGGIRAADWHMMMPPGNESGDEGNGDDNQNPKKACDGESGSRTSFLCGSLSEEHTLAGYRSLGRTRALNFVYRSTHADSRPILSSAVTIPAPSALPNTMSVSLSVGGVDQGIEVFTDTASGLDEDRDETIRQSVQWAAQGFPTGLYEAEIKVTNHFDFSSLSTFIDKKVLVKNESQSVFGAGWGLAGLQRLHLQAGGDAVLTDGDGTIQRYRKLQPGVFGGPETIPLGIFAPNDLLRGDFNNDTFPDLAVIFRTGLRGAARIFPAQADGSFGAPFEVTIGDLLSRSETTDADRDGNLDFVTANQSALTLVFGNGDGTFSPVSSVPLLNDNGSPASPLGVKAGDMNEDGIPDLVTRNAEFNDDLSVLFGQGGRVFGSQVNFDLPSTALDLALEDFNRDGHLDILTAHSTSVSILSGDGTGGFSGPQTFGGLQFAERLTTADFNGDGWLDAAAGGLSGTQVFILLNNRLGGFFPAQALSFDIPVQVRDLKAGDLNDDGVPDLAAASSLGTVSVFFNDGLGRFPDRSDTNAGQVPIRMVLGDWNQDGIRDFAVLEEIPAVFGSDVLVFLNSSSLSNQFQSPAGEFSSLSENPDSTFTRVLKNGTRFGYDAAGFQTSVTDRNDNVTAYEYDGLGRLIRITDPVGLETAFEYAGDHLSEVRDPAGRVTQFDHDSAGNLVRIASPDGSFREFAYDAAHKLISQKSKRGFETTYDYNFAGRFEESHLPDGSSRKIASIQTAALVDPASGLGTESNPAPAVKVDQVEAVFRDGNGNETKLKTDRFGAATATTDPLGRTTVVERDMDSNPTRIVRANGSEVLMTYDMRGNLLTRTESSISATAGFTYDPVFNQVTSVTDPNGNTTTIHYDVKGNPIELVDALSNATLQTFDSRGLLLTQEDALGHVTSFEYDVLGNLIKVIDALTKETYIAYDGAGNIESLLDSENNLTRFSYDALNRLANVEDASNQITLYEYDEGGNLIKVTDARGKTIVFEYDNMDRIVKMIDPLNDSKEFAYDLNGHLTTVLDRKSQLILFEYDALGQLSKKTLPGNLVALFAYDEVGNLISAIDPDTVLNLGYDQVGRLISTSTHGSSKQPDISIEYTYDKNGARLSMTNGTTGTTTYVYDALKRPIKITTPSDYSIDFDYDELNRLTQLTFPNGVRSEFSFDKLNHVVAIKHLRNSTILSSFSYAYDKIGNIESLDLIRPGLPINNSIQYSYDSLSRLTQATYPILGNPNETFIYDSVGNRLLRNDNTFPSLFDDANRILEDEVFVYEHDPNGNLIQKIDKLTGEITKYAYDAENQLTRVDLPDATIVQYSYDAFGRRVEKDINGSVTRYVYDFSDIIFEFDESNIPQAQYTHGLGIDQVLAMEKSGGVFFYHIDVLGSVVDISDSSGAIAMSYVYDAFGNIALEAGIISNPFTFTSREFDSEVGLYYYRARYYDSIAGRFLQEDPIGILGGLNLYSYTKNNPINFIDPLGLFKFGKRPLDETPWWKPGRKRNPFLDKNNVEPFHEHGFFEDGSGDNFGFGKDGIFSEDPDGKGYVYDDTHFDDRTMRDAFDKLKNEYKNQGYCVIGNNCQDFSEKWRELYEELKSEQEENDVDVCVEAT